MTTVLPSVSRWSGDVYLQQMQDSVTIELCFGPVEASEPGTGRALGCPGIATEGFAWAEPPPWGTRYVVHNLPMRVTGELSVDRLTFRVSTATPDGNPTTEADRTRLAPSPEGWSCRAGEIEDQEEIFRRIEESGLRRTPAAVVSLNERVERAAGEARFQVLAAFVTPDLFDQLCEAGIGLQDTEVYDLMTRVD